MVYIYLIVNGWKGIDWKFSIVIGIFLFSLQTVCGQRMIKGQFIDKELQKPIPQATLSNDSLSWGTSTDNNGYFSIPLPSNKDSIWAECRALGYETQKIKLFIHSEFVKIELKPDEKQIESVEIQGKQKYKNKNNPAVELIKQVIKYKKDNRLSTKQQLQYQEYEKLKVGMLLSPSERKIKKGAFDFFFDNADTLSNAEEASLPVFLKESNAQIFSQKKPKRSKKIIEQEKETLFDSRYVNNPNIQAFIDDIFQPVDVYDESIYIVRKLFLSPISDNAPLYYKFYIQDTLEIEGKSYTELLFKPRNSTDLLLQGTLQISTDGRYAVRNADFKLSESANINFVNNVKIQIDYSPNKDGVMLPSRTHVYAVFGLGKSNTFFGDRLALHSDYDLDTKINSEIFSGPPVETSKNADTIGKEFERPVPLTETEQKTYKNIDSLNNMKSFRSLLAAGYLLGQGYFPVNLFEIGPLEYAYSQNNIEGQRIRIGGRSTPLLSDKVYIEGYTAYGFRDESIKYNLKTAVSLNKKNITHFPAHYIEGTIQKDIFEPGKNLGFLKGDSFFQSFKKNKPTKWIDTEAYRLRHVIEFGNHFSFHSSFTHQRRYPIGDLQFVSSDPAHSIMQDMHTNEAEFMLRWAPYEKFYFRNLTRKTIVDKFPVLALTYSRGLDGFWDGDYAYDKLAFAIGNRFFLNQFGFFDVAAEIGNYWGRLPYPLLEIPTFSEENERYTVSYDLINPMEFVADRYAKIALEHQLEGFILNKIPLLKKLKLREIWGFSAFAGSLSAHNNPALSDKVIEFEKDDEGNTMTRSLSQKPYTEGYVGIDNILKILRVQYIKRFNYLNSPSALHDKIRLSLHINF